MDIRVLKTIGLSVAMCWSECRILYASTEIKKTNNVECCKVYIYTRFEKKNLRIIDSRCNLPSFVKIWQFCVKTIAVALPSRGMFFAMKLY